MRRSLAIVFVVLVLFSALALFMQLFSGGGGVSVPREQVVWSGCDRDFCVYVLRDGRFIGVRGGKEVFSFLIDDLLAERIKFSADFSIGVEYKNEQLVVSLYRDDRFYVIPLSRGELRRIVEEVDLVLKGPRLQSLDGSLVCLGCDEITRELWSRMTEFSASDPRIEPYVEWLRKAMAPEPRGALNVSRDYWWFDDGHYTSVDADKAVRWIGVGAIPYEKCWGDGCALCWGDPSYNYYVNGTLLFSTYLSDRCMIPPPRDSVVRVGLVKLPFGAGLVVSVYQTGKVLTVVVHGTIVNETEWRELLARLFPFSWDSDVVGVHSVGWVLWRALITPRDTRLLVNGSAIPVRNVVVLLEMPVYTLSFTVGSYIADARWLWVEPVYWDVVAHPALALATRLAAPPNTDIRSLYEEMAIDLTRRIVLTGVRHPGWWTPVGTLTPFLLREKGYGICGEQSWSTSLFASNALGAHVAYVVVNYTPLGHAISFLLHGVPDVWNNIDVDGDGEPDDKVIVDTANLDLDFVAKNIKEVVYGIPLLGINPANRYIYLLSGAVDSVLGLPEWLKAPWLSYTLEKSNFTEVVAGIMKNATNYCEYLVKIDGARRIVNSLFSNITLAEPPSVLLALGNASNSIPVVYEAETPPIPSINCTSEALWQVSWGWSGGGGQQSEQSPPLPPVVNVSVNVVWDGSEYRGSAVVYNHTVTVVLSKMDIVNWAWYVWIDGVLVDGGTLWGGIERVVSLETTYKNTKWNITVYVVGEPVEKKISRREVNATMLLEPVYSYGPSIWGSVPVFKGYRGSVIVDGTNVTIFAWYCGSYYCVERYVNGSLTAIFTMNLTKTISFEYNGTRFELSLVVPEAPVLSRVVESVLEPENTVLVPLPNGTFINVTIYKVNISISLGNVVVALYGFVSRIAISMNVEVFGVPPANYTVSIEGLEMNKTIVYQGALFIHAQYDELRVNGYLVLIPEGTVIKIVIEPLNITVVIPVKS